MVVPRCARLTALTVVALLCALAPSWSFAQQRSGGAIRGAVIDSAGRPIENADVSVEQLKLRTRTGADGRFLFVGVKPGRYDVGVRSIGYESGATRVTVRDSVAVVQFALRRTVFSLPARVTTANRGGLSGVIADTGYAALADVRVRVVGADQETLTDAKGAFFLPVKPGRYLLRLEREGYARQLVGVTIPESEGREIAAWMTPQKGNDNPQIGANLFDLRKRLISAGPATRSHFTREEIDKFGQRDMLAFVRGVAGYPIGSDCWVTVNGGPRKDPIWRMSTDEVEFIEMYERPRPRVTAGPPSGSRERLAEQRLDQATTQNALCSVTIVVWTR